ncbi:MAG: glycosyltransferase [Panacagrimonas sp.]
MAKVVVVTQVDPVKRSTGGEVATTAFVDAMKAGGHEVTTICFARPGPSPAGRAGVIVAEQRHIETSQAGLRLLGWMLMAFLCGRAYSVQKFVSRPYREKLRTLLAEGADVVVIDHAQMGWVLEGIDTRLPVALIAHNVESELYAGLAKGAKRFFKRWIYQRESSRIGQLEQKIARRAVQIWTLTEPDAQHFRSLASSRVDHCAVPGGACDYTMFHPVQDVARTLGTWTWHANAVGLEWFMAGVVPHLAPEVRVEVGGRGAEKIIGNSQQVASLGFVPDAFAFLAGAKLIVIPSTEGAGVQIKTLDAIATGRPIVCTTVAVRGLDKLPRSVRVADDPKVFAAAVTEVLHDESAVEPDAEAIRWAQTRRTRFFADVADSIQNIFAKPRG